MAGILETARHTIAENFGGAAQNLANKEYQFTLDEVPDLKGKVAVVTGGSEGIGYGFTHTLLANNVAKIFSISLSQEVINGASEAIQKELGSEVARKVTWLKCDLADLPGMAKIASKIVSETDRVDILFNNAGRGIMTYQLTEYGIDRHMAANHFGHVVLTSTLMPLMKRTAEKGNTVRIVGTSSNAHQAAPSDTKFESLEELNQDLGPNGQYGRSKLAVVLYAKYLTKHVTEVSHPNILINAIHPGFVKTKMSEDDIHEPYPIGGYGMEYGMAPFKKDQWEGCTPAVFAATKTEKSGQYICPPAIPEAGSKLAQDEDGQLAEALMKLTKEVILQKFKKESVDRGCKMEFY